MNHSIMGVINLIHEPDEMERLTAVRCAATVPFGARYRLIDFVLSGMVNSGVSKVAVFAHTKYRSLMDHLESGRHWDLHHRQSGLFVLPPATGDIRELSRGDLYYFYQNRDYFDRTSSEYVIISRSHMVCNVDLQPALAAHKERGADITVVCKRMTDTMGGAARKVRLDGNGRIVAMQDHYGRMDSEIVSMEMYLMRKDLLLELVETSLAQGEDHLVRHAIMSRLRQLNVQAYMYDGYLGIVNTVESYFRNHMKLLNAEAQHELFSRPGPIFTKLKDEPPSRYLDNARVVNSLVADGCVIEGTVEDSVLFRGVKIGKGAVVRNSIVMQNSVIGEQAYLERCILDKDVRIASGRDIRGTEGAPFMAAKRKVV
ncbi:glucose-1-phosphate adenylyltransferase subunit GlgD [Paenibacillus cisolokensis]|uniref:glucose-1-phosphate adenylyltransferase subunit GlgD n=1 Tax=Paenibacillus TaxID=44249 RepID=UPI000721B9D5|nr:glucose-1-phosphate adenylyltransferase subunit GlgD [Paenibacillus sp. 32O-W]ALS28460.1 glucose-1-phosphate adenylyltransferase [Paenibacillus sp. 32O-W]